MEKALSTRVRIAESATALAGGPSTTRALEPMEIAGLASFGAFVPVGASGTYKIRFEVKRSGLPGSDTAEFEHRIADPRRK